MHSVDSASAYVAPVQGTGFPAGSGQALPAGHSVQFSNLPPSENIPVGHGTGGLLASGQKKPAAQGTHDVRLGVL